jgi:hypothetical protein
VAATFINMDILNDKLNEHTELELINLWSKTNFNSEERLNIYNELEKRDKIYLLFDSSNNKISDDEYICGHFRQCLNFITGIKK